MVRRRGAILPDQKSGRFKSPRHHHHQAFEPPPSNKHITTGGDADERTKRNKRRKSSKESKGLWAVSQYVSFPLPTFRTIYLTQYSFVEL